ncbi:MAG: 2-C-methyl-D-erythritol 4-phosphate cytidylyltransferase [Gammaproteobacteria bacterium]
MNRLYAIVPAAGVGRRMGGEVPKQYLAIGARSVLEHTLFRIAGQPGIARVIVPVAAHDARFATLTLPANCVAVVGGAERCHSVLAGLDALAGVAADDDWVLVHDAARPCVRGGDIARMVEELDGDTVGGILAVPVRDTLKRCGADGRIEQTVPRDGLWQAQTPQMFRFRLLREAIAAALAVGELVTDEAQAIERAGHVPRVVAGHGDNLKITQPEDLDLAARILAAQATADA